MDVISQAKEERYQQVYRPHLELLPGLLAFIKAVKNRNIKMAIGSAAPRFNIDFALDNLNIRKYFEKIISGDEVTESKPHPEVYLAAKLLDVKPADCVVFEDSPKGVEGALRAGMLCIVITTMHVQEEFKEYKNILLFIKDYTDPQLSTCLFITS